MGNRNPKANRAGEDIRRVSSSPAKRTWGVVAAAALVLGLGVYLVLGPSPHPVPGRSGALTSGAGAGFNVLLITLDTTRADRLGCYGYEAAQTPAMDAVAESGIRFEQAFCHVPLTLPSHASLLTGLCPPSIGVRINGAVALGEDVGTIAEAFKSHGYRTGAFIGAAVLDSGFGLNRGFDVYDDDMETGGRAPDEGAEPERPADRVCASALGWLMERPDEPFFAWVHFFDPHTPYAPPPGFVGPSGDRYDGEIAFMDSQVRRLTTWLDDSGLRDRTMIVLVGDHGEGLWDHDEPEHGYFVYNTTMRIPLILQSPHFPTPRTIAEPVRLVDVYPTIIDSVGWEVPADLDGRSLAHACRTGEVPALPVYGECEYPRVAFHTAPLRSLIVDQWKFIDVPKPELYDWKRDPGELTNLIAEHPKLVRRMRNDLAALESHMKLRAHAPRPAAVDSEALEQLAALGYVAGTSTLDEPDRDAELPDPKDGLAIYHGHTRALSMMVAHDYEGAVDSLEPIIHLSPDSGEIHGLLATAYLKLDRFAEAQRAFEASLRTAPPNRRRLFGLGEALRNQNKLDEAIPLYEQALALSPDWDMAHQGLATVFSKMKRYSEAEGHWRRCVESKPTSAYYLTNLGTTLFAQRRPAEAVPVLQKALQRDPANEYAYRSLWQSLAAVGLRAEAIQTLRAARELLPAARSITCPLAWLLATTPGRTPGEIRDAVQWAEECCEAGSAHPRGFDALGAAYAAMGDFSKAAEAARRAISMAAARGQIGLQRQIEARLRLYEEGKPYLEPTPHIP